MTTYFISRHQGAKDWAKQQGFKVDIMQAHLDIGDIKSGDRVVGTLPINIIAELNQLGASYFHLILNLPAEMRGKELTASDMTAFGATIQQYQAEKVK